MKPVFLLSVIFLARQASSTGGPLYQYDPNTAKDCVEWYNNDEGDSCVNVRNFFSITPAEFSAWNPLVNANCEPWYEYVSYCIVTETKLNSMKSTAASSSRVSSSMTSVTTLGPSPTAWVSLGCYVEDPNMPILEQNMNPSGDSALTIPKCKNNCYSHAFEFAGIQKGNQCWCSTYVGGEWASNQTSCNSTCTGDKSTFCGGNGFLNVFKAQQNQASAPASTTASSLSAVASKSNAAKRSGGFGGLWLWA